MIHCVESAGANLLQYQTELWSVFGGVFRNLAQMSAMGLPTMVVLHGGSTAGGAYMPGMSDYVIGVKENGMAALGGAALVKAATGEVANDRELGGTEMHASVSGVVEYLVEDDAHGLLKRVKCSSVWTGIGAPHPYPVVPISRRNILRSSWLARANRSQSAL